MPHATVFFSCHLNNSVYPYNQFLEKKIIGGTGFFIEQDMLQYDNGFHCVQSF